jgi:hypothetical protein
MRKIAIFAAATLVTLASLGTSLSQAHAQAIGPTMIDSLTEGINSRQPGVVLDVFASGGTVTFDNSPFGVPDQTISAAEYAARFTPSNPDVPADVQMQVAPGSVNITENGATWTWRQSANFLLAADIQYIEYTVVATTEAGKFKSITITPTPETVALLPYSPSLPVSPGPMVGTPGPLTPGMPTTGSGSPDGLAFALLALAALGLIVVGRKLAYR